MQASPCSRIIRALMSRMALVAQRRMQLVCRPRSSLTATINGSRNPFCSSKMMPFLFKAKMLAKNSTSRWCQCISEIVQSKQLVMSTAGYHSSTVLNPSISGFNWFSSVSHHARMRQRSHLCGNHQVCPINNFPCNIISKTECGHMTRCISSCAVLSSEVPLTRERFPDLSRGHFARVGDDDIKYFQDLLEGRIVTDEDELAAANTDWLQICRGSSCLLLRPKTTEEVAKILAHCNAGNLAVVPQGGNTGLVGGSVPIFDEIIISTALLNKIISIDETSGAVVAQAGCILEKLDTAVSELGLVIPLDLGAKGSCCIGGNVSTNAGGLRVLRYGSLHGSVLGVEAVMADGRIVDCLSSLSKDNTGYDLKQLFIGSEGTLGIVTAVAIKCPQRPKSVNLAFLGVADFENVKRTFRESRKALSEILSACELMDHASMQVVEGELGLTNPLSEYPFYMLIETSGSNTAHDEEKLNSFLEGALHSGFVSDGTVATDGSKVTALWSLRERITEGLLRMGWCFKYDLTIPINHFYSLVEETRERLAGIEATVVGYGHVGDENLHLNVVTPTYDPTVHKILEPFVYDWTSSLRGSVSAEHGLGFLKRNYIGLSKAPEAVSIMRGIKTMMDPKGILNPYKVLPTEN